MKDIYTLSPINKTAAFVVGQSGCTSHEGLSLEQQKANLCAKWHELENKIMSMHKKDPSRKAYGKQIHELHEKISEINKQIKFRKHGDLSEYIVKIIKSRMTKLYWNQLLEEAEKERTAARHYGTGQNIGQQRQHKITADTIE
jgi:uncharacterized FlaG/YvyC family protein